MSFITKCCTPSFRTNLCGTEGGVLTPKPSELSIELASLGRRRARVRFRRRGSRCYVLLDEIPEGCREQEGYQLRPPVLQEQCLHNVRAIKSRRSAGETFPA